MSTIKCAIYTRKSTEHGLEQEFNSLQNQDFGAIFQGIDYREMGSV